MKRSKLSERFDFDLNNSLENLFHSMDDNQKTFLKQRETHNKGQYTEKRIHLSSRLPYWLQAITPRVFYVIEKSWNFYPYTITGESKFSRSVAIESHSNHVFPFHSRISSEYTVKFRNVMKIS